MDSAHSGPLTTLILVLPLIVVPALVMLRPPEQDSGFGNDDLSAADEDRLPPDSDDFDAMFGTAIPVDQKPASGIRLLDEPLSRSDDANSQTAGGGDRRQTYMEQPERPTVPAYRPDSPRDPDLTRWGVTKSVWFVPGESGTVGFAAFVPTQDGRVRYRFAAIGTEEREVVQDVTRQIEIWQSNQTVSADGRTY